MIKYARNLLLLTTTVLSACSGADQGTAAEATQAEDQPAAHEAIVEAAVPVATIEVGAGHRVEFYEMGDRIVVSEVALEGVAPLLGAEQDTLAIYEALAPGQALPDALLDAMDRVSAKAAEADREPAPDLGRDVGGGHSVGSLQADGAGSEIASVTQAVSTEEFLNRGGCDFNGAPDWQVCYTDWTGHFYAYAYSRYTDLRVASIWGEFTAVITAPRYGGHFLVRDGEWRSFFAMGPSCPWYNPFCDRKTTLRLDIHNAEGDYYNVAGIWYNGPRAWNF